MRVEGKGEKCLLFQGEGDHEVLDSSRSRGFPLGRSIIRFMAGHGGGLGPFWDGGLAGVGTQFEELGRRIKILLREISKWLYGIV